MEEDSQHAPGASTCVYTHKFQRRQGNYDEISLQQKDAWGQENSENGIQITPVWDPVGLPERVNMAVVRKRKRCSRQLPPVVLSALYS